VAALYRLPNDICGWRQRAAARGQRHAVIRGTAVDAELFAGGVVSCCFVPIGYYERRCLAKAAL